MQAAAARKSVTCSTCGAKYSLSANYKGSAISCRRCGNRVSLGAPRPSRPSGARRTTGSRRAISMRRKSTKLSTGQVACAVGVLALLVVAIVISL